MSISSATNSSLSSHSGNPLLINPLSCDTAAKNTHRFPPTPLDSLTEKISRTALKQLASSGANTHFPQTSSRAPFTPASSPLSPLPGSATAESGNLENSHSHPHKRTRTEAGLKLRTSEKRPRYLEPSDQTLGDGTSNHGSSNPIPSFSHTPQGSSSSSSAFVSMSSSSPFAPAMRGPNGFPWAASSSPFIRFSSTSLFAPAYTSFEADLFPPSSFSFIDSFLFPQAPHEPTLRASSSAFIPLNSMTLPAPAYISGEERIAQSAKIIKALHGFEGIKEICDGFPDILQVARTVVFNHLTHGATPPEMAIEIIGKLVKEVLGKHFETFQGLRPNYYSNYIHEAYTAQNLSVPRDWEPSFLPMAINNKEHRQLIYWFFGRAPSFQSKCSVNFSELYIRLFPRERWIIKFCENPTSSSSNPLSSSPLIYCDRSRSANLSASGSH